MTSPLQTVPTMADVASLLDDYHVAKAEGKAKKAVGITHLARWLMIEYAAQQMILDEPHPMNRALIRAAAARITTRRDIVRRKGRAGAKHG